MRISDSRYAHERDQLELAMRMIAYEARTCTIRSCTGLSDDRIRKIYSTYFKGQPRIHVRRQRGKPPTQIAAYVKDNARQGQATTLGLLYCEVGLIAMGIDAPCRPLLLKNCVDYGKRVCLAYDVYCLLHPQRSICFERGWFMLDALVSGDELQFTECSSCQSLYLHDALALTARFCPGCQRRRRTRQRSR